VGRNYDYVEVSPQGRPTVTDTTIWICPACGANYPPAPAPPDRCPLCEDERQWVPPSGQAWTTMKELEQTGHHTEVREHEPGLLGIGVQPGDVGVGQRGLLVSSTEGNLLWDPPVFIDQAAINAVEKAGGLAAVSASHPHMYGAIVEWSHAFDAEILLAEVDRHWLMRPDPAVRVWSGSHEALPGVRLIQCGGHFPGSAVAHWSAGAEGGGALFVGDTLFVTPGADRVSFIWSAPNRLPLPERSVRRLLASLAPYEFERIYGGWWRPVIDGGAKEIVERSAARYIELVRGEVSPRR
jgi:glyoxylase-like metal-dependent hydrolase (beta-lactamase superfamily II)